MPHILASINILIAIKSLRNTFLKYENKGSITNQSVLDVFLADVQLAHYKVLILDIASAYDSLNFICRTSLTSVVEFTTLVYYISMNVI